MAFPTKFRVNEIYFRIQISADFASIQEEQELRIIFRMRSTKGMRWFSAIRFRSTRNGFVRMFICLLDFVANVKKSQKNTTLG